jgi:hypothetical protein
LSKANFGLIISSFQTSETGAMQIRDVTEVKSVDAVEEEEKAPRTSHQRCHQANSSKAGAGQGGGML